MKICYREINFRRESRDLIDYANSVVEEYQQKGYELTLRQVYYQLVARGVIPNNERSYKNLGGLISDGRMAGLIDWYAIIDRTRNLRGNGHWDSPAEIISTSAAQFQFDKWADQEWRVEVWVEKDALVGVVGQVCSSLDVSYFSCRGYVSQSEMWSAAQRLRSYSDRDKGILIVHLGDHDPSGIDMSRDIEERLNTFGCFPTFKRIALNMDQIQQYNPPPNPAKLTDSRCQGYIAQHGYESWELDALRPEVIEDLIKDAVAAYRDDSLYTAAEKRQARARTVLRKVSKNWGQIEQDYA